MQYPSLSDELLNGSRLCIHLWNKILDENSSTLEWNGVEWNGKNNRSREPPLFVLLNIHHFLRYCHSSFSMFEKFELFIVKVNSLKASAV